MAKVTNYSPEYKKEIIKLVTEQGKTQGEVARGIGVSSTTIGDWIKKYSIHGENAFSGKGHLRPEEKEYKDLLKKIKDLEEENTILKKSHAHLHSKREVKYKFIKEKYKLMRGGCVQKYKLRIF